MSVSDVQIANYALAILGSRATIQGFDENSNEAARMKQVYEITREAALRAHHWKFATGFATPAAYAAEDPPSFWDYAYVFPSDCLNVRYIVGQNRVGDEGIAFDTGLADDKVTRLIYTDKENAEICYTRDLEEPSAYAADFITAFATLLAVNTCMAITGSEKKRQSLLRDYTTLNSIAKQTSNNEQHENQDYTSEGIRARA